MRSLLATLDRAARVARAKVLTLALRRRDPRFLVNHFYWRILGRPADPVGLQYFVRALENGRSLFRVVKEIDDSPEAAARRQRAAVNRPPLIKCLSRRNTLRQELDALKSDAPQGCWIMGTNRFLTPETWRERALELSHSHAAGRPILESDRRHREHSGRFDVTAITSLYKGGRYIKGFLENIVLQTMFNRSELIIIDACSPEDEELVIAEYVKHYPNIIYKRMSARISIYEAWNIAIKMARGAYLTTTNVDDLRARDSFELQAAALDRHEFADVIYQDFFYTLDPTLSFEQIESFGFKSMLPIINKQNILQFNSPHNAPMWRKTLHDEVGFFDTGFNTAADWEFWLRCVFNGKKFLKLNRPHVAYYYNPEGISTRLSSATMEESSRIAVSYYNRSISMQMSLRKRFFKTIGLLGCIGRSHYEPVKLRLRRLGGWYKTAQRVPNQIARRAKWHYMKTSHRRPLTPN
jgi:glycosyltransferase involved in cell wall biosynthesis